MENVDEGSSPPNWTFLWSSLPFHLFLIIISKKRGEGGGRGRGRRGEKKKEGKKEMMDATGMLSDSPDFVQLKSFGGWGFPS